MDFQRFWARLKSLGFEIASVFWLGVRFPQQAPLITEVVVLLQTRKRSQQTFYSLAAAKPLGNNGGEETGPAARPQLMRPQRCAARDSMVV